MIEYIAGHLSFFISDVPATLMGNHHAFGRAPASAPASRPRACGAKRRHQATRPTPFSGWKAAVGGGSAVCRNSKCQPKLAPPVILA